MIVKHYMEAKQSRDRRERAGAEAERQMAHYLHRKFQDSPTVCILHQLRIEDPDQPEQDGAAGVCQIDHLVVHRWGFFLVESKSVTEAVQVRSDGDGGDEWSRTYRGEQKGIPSPIRQAKRQSDFLRKLLQRHRTELLGRFPIGLRSIARMLHGGDHRSFRGSPMQLVIAVSDNGRICRLGGWKPPERPFRVLVTKADLVSERIDRELDRHRRGANPLPVRPVGEYGLWSMKAVEVLRVAEFLAGRHVERSADLVEPSVSCGCVRPPHRHGEPWPPEDERELLRLHGLGWENATLAEQFGRTPHAIELKLKKLQE